MKAIVWTKYGSPDGLKLRQIAKPVPKDNEVLVKIYAAAASTPDTEFRRLKLPFLYAAPLRLYLGISKPIRITILGSEFAGKVEATGNDVTQYKPGDPVFGYTGLKMGTYAEYICLPEKPSGFSGVMARKPASLSYEEAAAASFGGLEAFHSLKKANIQRGQKVLIVGAGGSIGTWGVQIAKHYGAEVTGVDHTVKLETMRSIGTDHVIDYTKEDFTKNGQSYDVIYDTIGKSPFWDSLHTLKEGGHYINANPGINGAARMRRAAKSSSKKIIPWEAGYSNKNLLALTVLIEAGSIRTVIDRRYPLEQAAEAHRYVETGLKKGNVILIVSADSDSST